MHEQQHKRFLQRLDRDHMAAVSPENMVEEEQPQDQQETVTEEDTQQTEQDEDQPIPIQQHNVPTRSHHHQKKAPVHQFTDAEIEAQNLAQSLAKHK